MSSTTGFIGVFGVAIGIASAPIATADPSDLVPPCSADQIPQLDNCSTGCLEGAPLTSYSTCSGPGTGQINGGPGGPMSPGSPGADPDVPLGPQ
jgi:hypothetical protein